jgi:transcriptional regulator with XRE-family HTH domain
MPSNTKRLIMIKEGKTTAIGARDLEIAQRLKMARKMAALRPTDLGQKIGVSFQQVQKYERGTDCVSAATLEAVATATGQPILFFYARPGATVIPTDYPRPPVRIPQEDQR